jgi:hypothetical protein
MPVSRRWFVVTRKLLPLLELLSSGVDYCTNVTGEHGAGLVSGARAMSPMMVD